MFIELETIKGEKITFNTGNIVLLAYDKKGTFIVDVNGIDFIVKQSYESLKGLLQTVECDKSCTNV